MSQLASPGALSPCATPTEGDDGTLLLPVPAGRRASDFAVALQAVPGTRIEPPQELALDGSPALAR
jgi:hypothetical protein